MTISSLNTYGVKAYIDYRVGDSPYTVAQYDTVITADKLFDEGINFDPIVVEITTPGWVRITGIVSYHINISNIWDAVRASDQSLAVTESKTLYIEDPNYPELVHCDIVARYFPFLNFFILQ